MPPSRPIVIALSGGVDSATAAAVLVEQGHNVIGITMRLYDASGTAASVGGRCCGPRDIEDARRVSDHLGIPFYVVDFEDEFSDTVVDDFVDTYLRGDTPNPCVRCNQYIKFTPLLRRARALGADLLATGHYARLEHADGKVSLFRGKDSGKDQSYFLFSMPIDELAAIRFPLGSLSKDEVRDKARALGLPVADKPDSQEICFVPDGDYAGFVERRAQARGLSLPVVGEVHNTRGEIVGHHNGTHRYTIGQRRGLGDLKTGGKPVYVVKIDRGNNRVVVGEQHEASKREMQVGDVRWFADEPRGAFDTTVQVRHRSEPVPVVVEADGSRAQVRFTGDAPIAAPGQAAVFYDGDRVLGGGWVAHGGAD